MKLPSKQVTIMMILLFIGIFIIFSGGIVKGNSLASTEVAVSPAFQKQLESSLADINEIRSIDDIQGIDSAYHVMATEDPRYCQTAPQTCAGCNTMSWTCTLCQEDPPGGGGNSGGGSGGGSGPSPDEIAAQDAINEAEAELEDARTALEEAITNGNDETIQELQERVKQAELKLQDAINNLEKVKSHSCRKQWTTEWSTG